MSSGSLENNVISKLLAYKSHTDIFIWIVLGIE